MGFPTGMGMKNHISTGVGMSKNMWLKIPIDIQFHMQINPIMAISSDASSREIVE